jgi:two-component system chemotaxis response regulator CheB
MHEAIVIGASAGGVRALATILSQLPLAFPAPIAIVQHIEASGESSLAAHFQSTCVIAVKEAEDKERLEAGTVYLAPAGYHLLIEADRTVSLSVDEKVNFSRPAIDLLFTSAADVYGPALIGVVLTGASADGAAGLAQVKRCGGLAIVQDPATAASPTMPDAAIAATDVDHVVAIDALARLLMQLCSGEPHGRRAAR